MKIDKSVPIPSGAGGKPSKYQWKKMEVGDSVLFDNEPAGSQSKPAKSARVYGYTKGVKFAARKEGNGVRIWRVE